MKRLPKYLLVYASLALGGGVGIARADPIGPDCGSCQGSIYTLSYNPIALADADALHETFQVTLTIDTSGYPGGPLASPTFIDSAAIKVSPNDVFASSSLVAAPTGVSNWTLVNGGLNAGGCSGIGGGFNCADYNDSVGDVGVAVGGSLVWIFNQTIDNGELFTDPFAASIKVRYVDALGAKVGALVSEGITLQPVPLPPAVWLLGSGLVGLIGIARRNRVAT